MRIRRIILVTCVSISIILFAEGIALVILVKSNTRKEDYSRLNITEEAEKTKWDEGKKPVLEPVNIVVLGLDDEEIRSDVILLLNLNPADGKINLLSFARDTRIRVRGRIEKINALIGLGGEKLAVKGIEQITGLPVRYYITINFAGFKKIIDALGGVEYDVPFNMDYDDPEQNLHIHLRQGKQLLDGNMAEQFVRYRKGNKSGQGYIDGDIGRIKTQQEFIKALVKQKAKVKYISKADDIFLILKRYMKTNIEIGDISKYAESFGNFRNSEINCFTIPGESRVIDGVWYFICDKKKTKEIIDINFFQ